MVDRLSAPLFLAIALLLIGLALFPLVRVIVGVDEKIGMQFLTVVMLLIGGLMSALTAMILLVRRQPKLDWSNQKTKTDKTRFKSLSLRMHACGLLLFTGIPLLNFLLAYWLWLRYRRTSKIADDLGQEVLNFQITSYLYLMLSLFLVAAVIGIIITPVLLVLHFLACIIALAVIGFSPAGKTFKYPANIPIIQSRPVLRTTTN